MSAIVTEGTGNIPEQPTLVMPNRVTPAIMLELEKALGGSSRVAWLVESSLRPAPEIMQHLQQTRAAGTMFSLDTPQAQVVENLQYRSARFDPWVGKIPRRREWQPTPVFLPENPMDRGAW